MITGIVLENFKCFPWVSINPKRVTAFVGPNGTGKSSVIQAFALLKQTVVRADTTDDFWRPDYTRVLVTEGSLAKIRNQEDMPFHKGGHFSKLRIAGHQSGERDTGFQFSYAADLYGNRLSNTGGRGQEHWDPTLKKLKIVPAIRGLTRLVYKLGDELVDDIALKEGVANQEDQTATNLGYTQPRIQQLSLLLQRITGVGLQADTVPPQSVEVKSLTPSGPVNIVSEGFGTNSLIMLLLQLVSAEKGATVMIEEPEIHLHPKAQTEVASVLAEVAKEDGKQVIMTTHSGHITGRLLTLVAEGTLTPDDVAIYAFEKDEAGVCTAKDLRVNSDGTIEGGINDFFETNLAEMNRFAQAQFNRLKPAE